MGVFSLLPFSTQDPDGSWVLQGINVPAVIPDGSADRPGVTNVVALASAPIPIRRVVVTNEIWHESFSDLLGTLTHGRTSVVLHSNSLPPVDPVPYQYTYIYEDNGEGDIPGSQPRTGPAACAASSAARHGRLAADHGRPRPHAHRAGRQCVHPARPAERQHRRSSAMCRPMPSPTTSLTCPSAPPTSRSALANDSAIALPLELYLRRGSPPTPNAWDQMLAVSSVGGCLSLNLSALPPLSAGRYFIGVFNPGDSPQTIRLDASVAWTPTASPR